MPRKLRYEQLGKSDVLQVKGVTRRVEDQRTWAEN